MVRQTIQISPQSSQGGRGEPAAAKMHFVPTPGPTALTAYHPLSRGYRLVPRVLGEVRKTVRTPHVPCVQGGSKPSVPSATSGAPTACFAQAPQTRPLPTRRPRGSGAGPSRLAQARPLPQGHAQGKADHPTEGRRPDIPTSRPAGWALNAD